METERAQSPSNGMLSLSSRIAQARERAEGFSSRNPSSQESHKESMDAIERERQRWTKLYEEKSVIIEQLERELGTTVDALHKKDLHPNNASMGISFESEPKMAGNTSIDLLNFTDALRKENSSLKLSFTHMAEKKNELEIEHRQLKLDHARLKYDLDELRKDFEISKSRSDRELKEAQSLILSLESQVIELKASGSTRPLSPQKLQETIIHRSSSEDHYALTYAREEIVWLRDIIV